MRHAPPFRGTFQPGDMILKPAPFRNNTGRYLPLLFVILAFPSVIPDVIRDPASLPFQS